MYKKFLETVLGNFNEIFGNFQGAFQDVTEDFLEMFLKITRGWCERILRPLKEFLVKLSTTKLRV